MADLDISQLPKTRKEAILARSKYYFTGRPCKHGHISKIKSINSTCAICKNISSSKLKKKNRKYYNEKQCEWARKNKEKINAIQRKYAKKNPEWKKAKDKKWQQANLEYYRVKNSSTRAMKRNAEGKYTRKDILNILEMQKYKCANCKKSLKKEYHIDHVISLAKGGTNWPKNLQMLCPSCNCSKGDSDPIEFARKNGKLI